MGTWEHFLEWYVTKLGVLVSQIYRVSVAPISIGGLTQQWIQDHRWVPSPGPMQFLGSLLKTIHASNMQLKWTSSFWLLLLAHLARSHCTWVLWALCKPPPARCIICMVHEGKQVASCVRHPLRIHAHRARVQHFAVPPIHPCLLLPTFPRSLSITM